MTIKKRIKKLLGRDDMPNKPIPTQTRSDDIYLVAFPKSGVTYLSFLIGNAVSEYLKLGMRVNFFNLHTFVPDIHTTKDIPLALEFYPFRRFIKSHAPYQKKYANIIYLARDPRDVLTSYYHFASQRKRFKGNISEFIRSEKYGLPAWKLHINSWLKNNSSQNLQIFKYENFLQNPNQELIKLFNLLGFTLDESIVSKAVKASNFESMKKSEEKTFTYTVKKNKEVQFVRSGQYKGKNQTDLSPSDHEYISSAANKEIDLLGYSK